MSATYSSQRRQRRRRRPPGGIRSSWQLKARGSDDAIAPRSVTIRLVGSPPQRIFISHSRADSELARALASRLRGQGLDVWIDLEIELGASWDELIREQLDAAQAFVLLISPRTQESAPARREMAEILKRTWADESRIVLPVLIGSAVPPGYLRDQVAIRVKRDDWERGLDALIRYLCQPTETGVRRTQAGNARLAKRLDELKSVAEDLAAAEEER